MKRCGRGWTTPLLPVDSCCLPAVLCGKESESGKVLQLLVLLLLVVVRCDREVGRSKSEETMEQLDPYDVGGDSHDFATSFKLIRTNRSESSRPGDTTRRGGGVCREPAANESVMLLDELLERRGRFDAGGDTTPPPPSVNNEEDDNVAKSVLVLQLLFADDMAEEEDKEEELLRKPAKV